MVKHRKLVLTCIAVFILLVVSLISITIGTDNSRLKFNPADKSSDVLEPVPVVAVLPDNL